MRSNTIYVVLFHDQCHAFKDKISVASIVGVSPTTIARRLKTAQRAYIQGYTIHEVELTPSAKGGARTKTNPF